MLKKKYLVIATATIIAVLALTYLVNSTSAVSSIDITVNSNSHTIVTPYEKSFRFVATIRNKGTTKERILVTPKGQVPKDWHLLAPAGQYELSSGQSANFVAVFEPGEGPGMRFGGEEKKFSFEFSWANSRKEIPVVVKTKKLPPPNDSKELKGQTFFTVEDSETNSFIENAFIVATLPSGMENFLAIPGKDNYHLPISSMGALSKIFADYNIDHSTDGYFIQVGATGYQNYFQSDFKPSGSSNRQVKLKPLEEFGDYKETKTIKSGYSIWWIRASKEYFAFSQGAHDNPDVKPPKQTKVILTDAEGKQIWSRKTGGESWGLDISADGQYIAAGSHDGGIYVWDRTGKFLWKHANRNEERVRWVKISPNGRYLLAGPVNKKPEESGIFDIKSGKLLWTTFTGDWLREGRFSSDSKIVYLSSANGLLHAFNTADGKLKWLTSGDYVIPFMLAINEKLNMAVATGKGRAFTALDLNNGRKKWQTVVDQTITAAMMADDGSVVGATVGGMAYRLDAKGKITWARKFGGVGHNGVYYTKNGLYVLLGGPNPTLFDKDGNILWQREPNKRIEMSGPNEVNTQGANATWLSEDATKLILGKDNGDIVFYDGSVKKGENTYNQLNGLEKGQQPPAQERPSSPRGKAIALIIFIVALFLIFLLAGFYFYKRK